MYQRHRNTFTPLRSVVGRAVPFDMDVTESSIAASQQELSITIKHRSAFAEASVDTDLLGFWPEIVYEGGQTTGVVHRADPHQPILIAPDPFRHPFPGDAPYKSVFGMAAHNSADAALSRELAVTFRIRLTEGPALIGGIAFSGYPALGGTVDKFGRNTSNFGLPREMRISIASLQGADTHESRFIDADLHYTQQVLNHSSGIHYFHVEPTLAEGFTLLMSDLPLLMRRVVVGTGSVYKYAQAYGVVIPYLYVYTYQEKAHYHHHVPGGVLGVVAQRQNATTPGLRQEYLSPEWQRLIAQGPPSSAGYQIFPASSIFRPGRIYHAESLTTAIPYPYTAREQFVSDPVRQGEGVSLIIQQCDETLRSIAGMALRIPVAGLRAAAGEEDLLEQRIGLPSNEVNLLDKVGVRIYELDFPSGVSLLDARKTALAKYKHLLAEKVITRDDMLPPPSPTDPPDQRTLRFKRASNHRCFEIEIVNLGDRPGNVVVISAAFIQSAHITLHPKLSRRLAVSRMHFRIVGSDLAEDYAGIGTQGFNFSIERLSGGQPIQQIMAIRSLADLMQSGMAKVLSNSRRRAVEFEKSNVYHPRYAHPNKTEIPYQGVFPEETNDNYHITESIDRNHHWHKVRSGRETYPENREITDQDFSESPISRKMKNDSEMLVGYGELLMDPHGGKYETYATTESGTYNEHMFPDSAWNDVKNYFQLVESVAEFRIGNRIIPTNPDKFSERFTHKYWNGLIKEKLSVSGLRNLFLGPASYFETEYIEDLIAIIRDGTITPDLLRELLSRVNTASALGQIALAGGFSSSFSVSPIGIGLSIGVQSPFPGMQFTTSFGSQGIITQQAQKTAYSYSKTFNDQARVSMNTSATMAGEQKRIVERRAVPGTDHKRIKGAEIVWQGQLKDIILGTVPLDISFPALAERGAVPVDEALRVRFGNGIGDDIDVDFWFDINETEISDDF